MSPDVRDLVRIRAEQPGSIAERAAARRVPAGLTGSTGRLFLVAADHTARGALRAGDDPTAMGNRFRLLERLATALSRPGVDGVLATPDIIEDLLLLGALEDKVVVGSMNRGGLAGTSFEIDDRFTAYDADALARMGLQGGKMLLRIDPDDPATAPTLAACAAAVGDLAAHGLMAMVEPFISHRVDGRVRNDLAADAVVRSATVAAGLGWTSAHTWLKLPVIDDMDAVLAATTLPVVLLGGEVAADQDAQFALWQKALDNPQVRGMVVGRSLLYPPDGDVASAVDAVVEMM
ncbi:Cgl0159 family (beta/alpha)8-fold protein [Nocardioides cynanchi]|uniref:Cgl0159 family (beta/alpha)8-fold protein n=1 Tax=Nocardioides cynanchi TaxID=2558918 RepID=UPI001246A2BF|nr:aldolase [Nocardioides cynanchi]